MTDGYSDADTDGFDVAAYSEKSLPLPDRDKGQPIDQEPVEDVPKPEPDDPTIKEPKDQPAQYTSVHFQAVNTTEHVAFI